MAIEIKAPAFPESVADGEVAAWHKQEGEAVARVTGEEAALVMFRWGLDEAPREAHAPACQRVAIGACPVDQDPGTGIGQDIAGMHGELRNQHQRRPVRRRCNGHKRGVGASALTIQRRKCGFPGLTQQFFHSLSRRSVFP